MNRIYVGQIFHSRKERTRHDFTYPAYFVVVDLDSLVEVSRLSFGFLKIRDQDYLDRSELPLKQRALQFIQKAFGPIKVNRIELLTSPALLGYVFNPVSFYFFYDAHEQLTHCLAEVNNTFGEKHLYAGQLSPGSDPGTFEFSTDKAFHVSPFFNAGGSYRFTLSAPSKDFGIKIELFRNHELALVATMSGQGRELTSSSLAGTIFSFPFYTFITMPRILWQAAILYFKKKVPVMTKPVPQNSWTIRVKAPTLFRRICQKLVLRFLKSLKNEALALQLPEGHELKFGSDRNSSPAQIQIHDYKFFSRCATSGDIGLGESFVAGEWSTPSLLSVFRFFIRNGTQKADREFPWSSLGRKANRLLHLRRANRIGQSQENIRAHYDLSNKFFSTFLDPSMTYSCGIFERSTSTLEEAQMAKLDRMIELAQIKASDHVLEIGCGWGSFALRAVQKTGCRLTGISLSEAQLSEARKRVQAAGLSDKIDLQLIDYRQLKGRFDKIVSIEMLEAVGHRYFGDYFESLERLLAPHGIVALQVITIPDQRYQRYVESVDWIQKHIFPGGELPSLSALTNAMAKSSSLCMERIDNIGDHYALTLSQWRKRLNESRNAILSLGFKEEDLRKWEYYFTYCEAGFSERVISTLQIQLSRPQNPGLRLCEST